MRTLSPVTLIAGTPVNVTLDSGSIAALIANESPYSIQVNIGTNSVWLPAWTLDYYSFPGMTISGGQFTLTPQNLTSAGNAPSTSALVTLVFDGDFVTGTYPVSLTRQTNIGNGVIPTTGTNSVTNDGNTAPTQVVEGTPSGAASSQLLLNNDGSGLLGKGLITIDNTGKVKQTTASNGAQIDTSLLPVIPTANLNSDTIPSGVTLPAAQVGSGALNSATTIAPSQLVGGSLSSSVTIAATAIRTGTLASGVTVPAAQISGIVAEATIGDNLGNTFFPVDNGTHFYSYLKTLQTASSARDILFQTWDGTTVYNALQLGDNATSLSSLIKIDHTGLIKQGGANAAAQIDVGLLQVVPTANLNTGTLPAGVTVPLANLGTGALGGSITIGATQITSGALAAGVTLGATSITSGALASGVTLAASSLTTGVAPTGVEIGTSATNKITMNGIGGGSQVGIISTGNALWLASDINAGLMFGGYNNGAGYVTMSNNGKRVVQALISTDSQGGSIPYFNVRWSTGNATGAGQNITWGNWFCFPTMADSNGTGGAHIFTGTTTPTGAITGDLWFKA